MKIIVWMGIIMDFNLIADVIDYTDVFYMANSDELKRYWARPDATLDQKRGV